MPKHIAIARVDARQLSARLNIPVTYCEIFLQAMRRLPRASLTYTTGGYLQPSATVGYYRDGKWSLVNFLQSRAGVLVDLGAVVLYIEETTSRDEWGARQPWEILVPADQLLSTLKRELRLR